MEKQLKIAVRLRIVRKNDLSAIRCWQVNVQHLHRGKFLESRARPRCQCTETLAQSDMQTISHPDVVVRTSRAAVAWLDLAMHAAVIVVLAGGAVKGWKGFVGTQIIPVGLESATVYEADSARDVPLGFTIAVTDQQKVYYPHQVRIGVSRAATGEKLRLLELREGQTTRLPGEDLEITPGRDPGERPGRCRRVAGAQRAGEPPGNEPLPDRLGRRCSGLGACCSA